MHNKTVQPFFDFKAYKNFKLKFDWFSDKIFLLMCCNFFVTSKKFSHFLIKKLLLKIS